MRDDHTALRAFTEAVSRRLPGTWEPLLADVDGSAALTEVYEQLWDLGITQWALLEFVNDRLGMLRDGQGRELVVLPRPLRQGHYLIAPLVPHGTDPGTVEDLTPFGVSVSGSPARAAETVRRRLLPRLDYALLLAEERGVCPEGLPTTGTAGSARPPPARACRQVPRRWSSTPPGPCARPPRFRAEAESRPPDRTRFVPTASLAPTDPLLSVRPVHLAGPGDTDLPSLLTAEHGWFRPYNSPTHVVLVSGTTGIALSNGSGPAPLSLTGIGWSVGFCHQVPAEITRALLDEAATSVRYAPDLFTGTGRLAGHHARTALLAAGWSGHQRDGYELVAAPDRRAALTFPLEAPGSEVMLTGAADTGTWTVRFTATAPEPLLTAAALALLDPAVRRADQLPARHRNLLTTQPLTEQLPHTGRSGAARARSAGARPAPATPQSDSRPRTVSAASAPAPRRRPS
ncbi:hypothetical protein [Kitasatospora sp. NPDC059327]|uniref:hypothetical protein n=1 Tax=Kitasatospora sp. NPDC059327 TaxID=3346803 RepID=UPI00368B412B